MPFFGVPIRNGLPIGLGSVAGFGAPQEFTPAELFIGGTAGTWYDPSDLTTMFTTSSGTTPVPMPGQGSAVSVGLMLDKSQGLQQFWSGYFDGSGDFLAPPSNSAFALGTADFTIECWAYLTAHNDRSFFGYASGNANGICILADATLVRRVYIGNVPVLQVSGAFPLNSWFHLALVKQSGTLYLYQNGVSIGSVANATNLTGTSFQIGRSLFNDFVGYISNFRVVKGTAVYTGTFTPPSPVTGLTAISGTSLLTCQNSTFIDNSNNAFAITVNGNTTTSQNIPLGNHAIAINDSTARPELRARVNLLVATATLSTQSVTTQATSYTLRFAGTGSITLSGTATGSYSAGTHTITCTAGTLTLTVSGTVTTADLRPANAGALLPAYQAVTDANTYDTAGFPLYLRFDGIDDGMYTPANLNLSATDKVGVFAGVRKLTDTQGAIVELSATAATNNGSFSLFASVGGLPRWVSVLRGTLLAYYEPATYTAPITNILATSFDIAGAVISNEIVPRVNGVVEQDNPSGANAGTGNFGTYPLYIGSRNNTSDWLNGHLYGLIVVGSAVSAGNISATESWMAGKTGLSL